MKQKYLILKNDAQNQLIIREFAELDKETLSLLCEESYDFEAIQTAMESGPEKLMNALRTPNMYPIGIYAKQIAQAVEGMFAPGGEPSAELFFDDIDLVVEEEPEEEVVDEVEAESGEIDELLTEDSEEDTLDDGKTEISTPKTTIRVADDEPADIGDD